MSACPIQTIQILLPGLLALTSILVIIIAFLLEQYILRKEQLGFIKKSYFMLIILMVFATIIGGITSFLSLIYIIKFTLDILYILILILSISLIFMVVLGISITALTILREV